MGVILQLSIVTGSLTNRLYFFAQKSVFIRQISYTSVASAGKLSGTGKPTEVFAYIAEDDRLNQVSCHLFDMPPGKAREICLVIGAAFQIADDEDEPDDPFRPVSGHSSEPMPGRLEEKLMNRKYLTALKVLGQGQFGMVYLADQASQIAYTSHHMHTFIARLADPTVVVCSVDFQIRRPLALRI